MMLLVCTASRSKTLEYNQTVSICLVMLVKGNILSSRNTVCGFGATFSVLMTQAGASMGVPVMIGGRGVVAPVHLCQEAAQLGLIQVQRSQHAGLLGQVIEEQGERVALCGLGKGKNVKLPAVFCSLQERNCSLSMTMSVQLRPLPLCAMGQMRSCYPT